MAVTIPQTAYTLVQAAALPGMLGDQDPGRLIEGRFIASEDLLPGRVVELDPTDTTLNKVRYPQTASAVGKLVGVVVYDSADQVGSFKAGDTVRILRRGKIWAEFNGTQGGEMLAALNVNSSSTIATNRGKFTDAAPAAGAGVEIYATKMLGAEDTTNSPTGLVLVELNGALT